MSTDFLYSAQTGDGDTGASLYSNEVTAESLNNIAIDLGNTEFSAFTDGETYAVGDLNSITSSLASKGILQIGNKCKVTASEKIITVADGVCIFDDGSKIRVPDTGLSIEVIENVDNYIFFEKDTSNNVACLKVSAEEPTDTMFVMLAKVDTDGTVCDLRQYSVSKILTSGKNAVKVIEGDYKYYSCKRTITSTGVEYVEDPRYYNLDISPTGANYVLIRFSEFKNQKFVCAYPLVEGEKLDSFMYKDIYGAPSNLAVTLTKTGNSVLLEIYDHRGMYNQYSGTAHLTLTFV